MPPSVDSTAPQARRAACNWCKSDRGRTCIGSSSPKSRRLCRRVFFPDQFPPAKPAAFGKERPLSRGRRMLLQQLDLSPLLASDKVTTETSPIEESMAIRLRLLGGMIWCVSGFLRSLLRVATRRRKKRRPLSKPAEPRLPTRELFAKFKLDGPIPCNACGYDLRGLPIARDANCPECGKPAFSSWMDGLSSGTGYPVDAFYFLIDAMRWRRAGGCPRPEAGRGASGFCRIVCAYALEQAGDPDAASELLAGWRIRHSEQLGALVYALTARGLFQADSDDSPDDFDGLPGVSRMIEQAERAGTEYKN